MYNFYDVKVGTVGFVTDEKKMLFPTEDEFIEYMRDELENEEED